MNNRNLLLRCALFLVLCQIAISAHAAQRWFHVEIIVFKQYANTNEQFTQNESKISWPSRSARVSSSQYPLSQLRQAPVAYAAVNAAGRMLNDSYGSLRRSSAYSPLVHLSWVQPVGANRISEAVRIQSGALNGLIKIQRGNYLHILADFEYVQEGVFYRLKEKRRLKLNETHYLDHPRLGIIARISPL